MGGSGKWIKSLVGLKAPPSSATAAGPGKGRKWTRLFRSNSSRSSAGAGAGGASPRETSSASSAGAFNSVVAAVARAPPADFRVIRQEWAAVRVQAAFRAFLARRALKALRGIVRLQALVRGRLVRRQLAVTLSRMQALLRVQERAMERRARCSADAQSMDTLSDRNGRADPAREAEEQWCDMQGSVNEVKSRMQMKHEGAVKRQRAIAYAHSQQLRSSKYSGRPSSPASSLRNHESYVEGWMATKPWDSGHMDANLGESHRLRNYEEINSEGSKFSDAGRIKIRRNNDSTWVEAKPPSVISASSSDFACDESSLSASSVTPESVTNALPSEARSDSGHGIGGPSYMSLTKSAKARLDGCGGSRRGQFQMQRQRSGGMPYYRRVPLSSLDSESNAGSDISLASRRLNNMSLQGQSMTRSLDKENENWF
uniref:Uncharacterized protein n=1 Tax=Avena sativa TaxID=4498 RepID=A0ACD5T7Y4_AVESA